MASFLACMYWLVHIEFILAGKTAFRWDKLPADHRPEAPKAVFCFKWSLIITGFLAFDLLKILPRALEWNALPNLIPWLLIKVLALVILLTRKERPCP